MTLAGLSFSCAPAGPLVPSALSAYILRRPLLSHRVLDIFCNAFLNSTCNLQNPYLPFELLSLLSEYNLLPWTFWRICFREITLYRWCYLEQHININSLYNPNSIKRVWACERGPGTRGWLVLAQLRHREQCQPLPQENAAKRGALMPSPFLPRLSTSPYSLEIPHTLHLWIEMFLFSSSRARAVTPTWQRAPSATHLLDDQS